MQTSLDQNRRQKVFNKGLFVCAGRLDIIKLTKTLLKVFHVSIWGGLELCLGG